MRNKIDKMYNLQPVISRSLDGSLLTTRHRRDKTPQQDELSSPTDIHVRVDRRLILEDHGESFGTMFLNALESAS